MINKILFSTMAFLLLISLASAQLGLDSSLDGSVYVDTNNIDTNANVQTNADSNMMETESTFTMNSNNTIYANNEGSELRVTLDNLNLNAEIENNQLMITNLAGVTTALAITPQRAVAEAEAETGGSCTEECEIELDEETNANAQQTIVYEVTVQKQTRVLGLWDAEMDIEAKVDAQTGQVVDVNRPWWFFLSSEVEA